MNTSKRSKRGLLVLGAIGLGLGLGLSAIAPADAQTRDTSRYPYDPVCPWGRVADGRGMLVRCITQAEARALVRANPGQPKPATPVDAGAPKDAAAASSTQSVTVTVGPVLVESGKLPKAEQKLSKAKERFEQCVKEHGGMTRRDGEVRVRFLVRERGRAEGVEVTKRSGVSAAAAKCIADVVDRRAVGLPDAPILAATLVVKLSRQGQ